MLFLVGGTVESYQKISPDFMDVSPSIQDIADANDTKAWDRNALRNNDADLIVKVADYIPPVKEKLEFEEI